MKVTVAIATYNRADEVEKTLETLTKLDATGCPEYEILLVDNNSTDTTAEVVQRMAPRFDGRLRYVRENKQGLQVVVTNFAKRHHVMREAQKTGCNQGGSLRKEGFAEKVEQSHPNGA